MKNEGFDTEAWLHEQADRATNSMQAVRLRFIAFCPEIFQYCATVWLRQHPGLSRADYLRRVVNNFAN